MEVFVMARRFGNLVGGLIAAVLLTVPGVSDAGQVSSTLRISLRVVASCSVRTQPLAFADYTSGGAAVNAASPGAIDVTCARGTPAAVYLEGDRTLESTAGARVAYELRANGNPWPAGEAIRVKGLGSQALHLALSGTVPAGQKVPAGDYEDQVVVRVVY